MKHLRLLFLLFTLSLFSPFLTEAYCQEQEGFFVSEAVLPSDQTYTKIEESSGVTKPGLRAKPGDIGGSSEKPQKVPVGELHTTILFLATISLFIYKINKTRTRRNTEL